MATPGSPALQALKPGGLSSLSSRISLISGGGTYCALWSRTCGAFYRNCIGITAPETSSNKARRDMFVIGRSRIVIRSELI